MAIWASTSSDSTKTVDQGRAVVGSPNNGGIKRIDLVRAEASANMVTEASGLDPRYRTAGVNPWERAPGTGH